MTRVIPFVVAPEWAGARLDHFLARHLRRASRTRIQQLVASGDITIAGRRAKPHSPVRRGETVRVAISPLPEPDVPMTFDVLYSDDSVMVVDKPALLPMHAGGCFRTRTLVAALAARFPGEPLQIAHRLDRETSGCVVVARGIAAARALKRAFARRLVEKSYAALVHGRPPWGAEKWATIDLPIARAEALGVTTGLRGRMVVAPHGASPAFEAQTRVRCVGTMGDIARVECRPETGRQHQIRAHLAAAGFPIVGDKLYGHGEAAFARHSARERAGTATPSVTSALFGLPRHALHAARISFPHPTTSARIDVESAFPVDLSGYWANCAASARVLHNK